MRILSIRTLHGPNVFASWPVLRMTLDLGELAETSSAEIPRFVDALLALLPGLGEHHCSRGRPGGFVERLREGTYWGHIIEHVALELSEPAGIGVTYGKTVYAGAPGLYDVIVEFENEAAMRLLLEGAFELVTAVLEGRSFDVAAKVAEAARVAEDTALGPSTRAVVKAAEKRGIPWSRLNDESLLVFGYGKHRRFVQATTSCRTSFVAVEIAGDKQLTKQLLERAGVPVPRGIVVRTADEAARALGQLRAPVVVKPLDGNQGKGVSLNLSSEAEVREAFEIAREHRPRVLVEEMVSGRNYRVLVVNGRMVAASERLPAHVVGDGRHTVSELVALENQNPLRADGHNGVLTKIVVDDVVRACLAKHGRSLDEVPAPGERFILRESVNLSTGGIARDVTDEVHPDTARLCERAARAIDLDICGIDLVADDISRPLGGGAMGAIIELNAAPGIRMHEHPSEGKPRDVGGAIVEMLYPPGTPSRIPIVSITGTNGKTTTTRMVGHVFGATGATVGMTTTEGIYVGDRCVEAGDTTGPGSARAILFDPTVDIAVLETARGGIVRRGLGYDWSDVAIMTNIGPDHLGQDGIESVDDLLWIKGVVAERVREGGTLVLNAEDPLLAALPQHRRMAKLSRNIVFFALDPESAVLREHVARGGTGYTLRSGWIVELQGVVERHIVPAANIPATFGGAALFQVANAMAAVAACRAQGVPVETVARALQTFDACSNNRGRTNLYQLEDNYVLLDYGHNPGAFRATCALAAQWEGRRLTGIVSLPGDRSNALLEACACEIANGGFHRILCKDDGDLRGRAPGEVPALLQRVVAEVQPGQLCQVIPDESEAIEHALATAEPGEVIVLFTEDAALVGEMLVRMGAVAVSAVPELSSGIRGRARRHEDTHVAV
ncbi:cyanophycin synthetase [Sorangium sp. So ce131]|uniref:cyanophycin synthetase n=1 Tax=Sorangium sp. So ce131 TaxID=3133282 RepID=UPI003F609983